MRYSPMYRPSRAAMERMMQPTIRLDAPGAIHAINAVLEALALPLASQAEIIAAAAHAQRQTASRAALRIITNRKLAAWHLA